MSSGRVELLKTPEAHPLSRWLEAGLMVAVCTDNTLMSAVTLPSELARMGMVPGSEGWSRLQSGARRGWFRRGQGCSTGSDGVEGGLTPPQ